MSTTKLGRYFPLYLMLLPAMVYLAVFAYVPMWGARLAFMDFSFVGEHTWVGLKHFRTLFSSTAFGSVIANTLVISAMKIFINFPMPIILALMLAEVRSRRFARAVQSVIYLPHFLSWVVIAGIFLDLLSLEQGAVNRIVVFLGGRPFPFLTQGDSLRWVFVFSEMWRSIGWDSLLFVAAIIRIDPDVFEAAVVDGAGTFRKIFSITLPAIMPTMITVFILNLGFFMNAGFDQVFNMMNDAVLSKVDILDTYVYRLGLQGGEFSYATAAGLFKGAIGLLLIFGTHYGSKRLTGKGVW
ncbi:MAG: protein lplB [Treponema sp. GWB1_62_6]|nr:MAG: protein lplB [Treponema sp. GWA1_62_8]OHE65448.1 MAG: protein lplB [Treponema sp. GWC1_61_84]OHE68254.1 MAG: protein lplB [Treponema sp. RIFOXYC1_FULL_61_9]OHE69545.1 MAG: protein lplB [Treponema sp. GWB1_62_6]HCM25862.1 protein lplB [Treponema sp.]